MDSHLAHAVPDQARKRAADFVGRQWVLHEVVEWFEHQPERYFLILGEPGIGKTALAAWLAGAGPAPEGPEAARLEALRRGWAAVHFCIARGQRGTVNPGGFARSLAEQLAQRYDSFATAAIERIAPNVNISLAARENWGTIIGANIDRLIISDRDAEDVYNRVVREPLQQMADVEPDLTVRILVDALDEGHTGQEPSIVTLIAGSGDFPPGVRFVMTSRNDARVTDQFDSVRKLDFSSSHYAAAAETDVRSYVSRRFAADERLRLFPHVDANDFQTRLVSHAKRNFLYAKWVLDELADGNRSVTDVTSLPSGLYGLYRTFLDRIVTQGGGQFQETWLGRHEPFFGCLTVAAPAAPETSLPKWLGWTKSQLNVEVEDVRQIVERVPDLPGGDDGYRLYHRSIADFLSADRYQEDGDRRPNRYYVEPTRQHSRIAAYYLSALEGDWSGDWTKSDPYGLMQLPAHLLGAGDDDMILDLLKAPFLTAKLQRFVSYQPIMTDLLTGIQVAERRGDHAVLLRLGICYAGIKECIGDLSPDIAAHLIALLAEAGEVKHAVELARMIDAGWKRGIVLRTIVGRLAYTDRREATRVAEQINDDPLVRAEAMETILEATARGAPSPDDLLSAATPLLAVVDRVVPRSDWERYWRSGILRRIAWTIQHVDPEQAEEILEQATRDAHAIEKDQWRYESLHLLGAAYGQASKPEALHLYDESLAAVATLHNKRFLASQAATTIKAIAALDLGHAIRTARTMQGPVERSFALAEIAHLLARTDAGLARSLIEEATAAAWKVHLLGKSEAEEWAEQAGARIARAIAARDLDAAVSAAEQHRPFPDVASLVPRDSTFALIAADQIHPLSDRLALARQIHDPKMRSTVLAALAREQMADDIETAASMLAEIPDPGVRCDALAEAAALLAERDDPLATVIIEQADQLAGLDIDPARFARLWVALAGHDAPRAARLFARALDPAASGGRPKERLEAHAVVAQQFIRNGHRVAAVAFIRSALKSAYDIHSQEWVTRARAQLLGELARQDPNQALTRAHQLPDPARLVALGQVIAAIADTQPGNAQRLFADFFHEADPAQWDWMVERLAGKALAALVLAAARRSSRDTVDLAERLWRYPDEMSMLNLKCDTLAKASGLLAASDPVGAERLLRRITPELSGHPHQVGRALSRIALRDSALAARLSSEVAASYMTRGVGEPDKDICEMCENLADVMPDLGRVSKVN